MNDTKSPGAAMIAAERQREIDKEGYDAAHDDEYNTSGELAIAGAIYALNSCGEAPVARFSKSPNGWPWESEYWKPKTPVRDLVRAGALMAAEIDRRLRAGEAG